VSTRKPTAEHYRQVVKRHQAATGIKTFALADVVTWAFEQGELTRRSAGSLAYHCRLMAEALRTDTVTDAQGRQVSVWLCARMPVRKQA
jgi:hypothetical protein